MNKEVLIKNLGLSDKEAAVYEAILEIGSSTIQPISKQSGIKRTSIYYFINHLVELGLVEVAKVRGRLCYKALPPTRMISLQQQRLAELQESLPQFMSIYNVSTNKPKISYYEGPEQIKNIVLEETRCKKEALYIWPAKDVMDSIGGTEFMEILDRRRKENGTFLKLIRFRDKEIPFYRFDQTEKQDLREIRYAPAGTTFPMAIAIYDTGKVGFLTTRKEGFGIMIESEELVQAMRFLFELFWEQSEKPA